MMFRCSITACLVLALVHVCLALSESHGFALGDFRQGLKALQDHQVGQTNTIHITELLNSYSVSEDDLDSLKLASVSGLSRIIRGTLDSLTEGESADNISAECLNASEGFLTALLFNREKWALQMLDAMGKPESSLLRDFRLMWLGSYSECVEIFGNYSTRAEDTFQGQYCLASVPLSQVPNALGQKTTLSIGVCVPDVCSTDDTVTLIRASIATIGVLLPNSSINAGTIHPRATCQKNDKPLNTRAIVAVAIVSVIVGLVLVGSLYDIYRQHINAQEDSEERALKMGLLSGDLKTTELGIGSKLLLSFSAYTNGSKILTASQSAGALECINGIRVLSMMWVVLGHTLALAPLAVSGIGDMGDFALYIKRWSFHAILNATVSVDSFFVLSGLLTSYLVLKEMGKKNGKINWLMYYVHRYIRLTPPYMFIVMVYSCLLYYTNSGPIWPVQDQACPKNWWTNVLYINNLVKSGSTEMCMAWSWYLANDMQFYVIAPLFIIPLFKFTYLGSGWVFLATLGSIISTGVISSVNHVGPGGMMPGDGSKPADFWTLVYIHPWTRLQAYTVGIYVGFLLYKTKCQYRMNIIINLLGWALAAFLCSSTLYGLYGPFNNDPWSNDLAAFYNATWRFAWSAGLGWVIFACCTGNGGPVNALLSWKGMIPLSRLTYCSYLVHPAIMIWIYNSQQTLIMLTIPNIIYFFFGHLVAAYSVAFVASLLFESPIMGVEKVLLGKYK